jgi:acyl-CoA synthetase (NDP forming)
MGDLQKLFNPKTIAVIGAAKRDHCRIVLQPWP